ncbi:RraA family protein [Paracoccus lutimaris]|uniref:Putative 4-hydroxy-4-methyl-2-oxoglutarate aldolase n=1 Tax=Paracoccus lutimaris TaxID=1490030 RepID=A0A368Z984_9RHOB|nr:RraA family protein [Paracoccus lutimaris]RCW87024.1 regulator of RNase E activity RraA [Paracoccus lutimaris]
MTDPRIATLEGVYTSVIHDVLRAMGRRNFTLPSRITPLQPDTVLAGPALTIEGRIDETADPHQTLLDWTGLLSQAPAGHIWVSQPHNQLVAQMGELSAETLHRKGVLGCVLDGGLRDANFILKLGFRSWRTFHTPRDVVGLWRPTAVNQPIMIGECQVRPGDWLHGDRDGMVVIPADILDEVIAASVEAMQAENRVRTAILDGTDPQEAYLRFGKF